MKSYNCIESERERDRERERERERESERERERERESPRLAELVQQLRALLGAEPY